MTDFRVDLNGQTAIVTGAGYGVGRAIALALATSGAAVAVNDINPDRAATTAAAITEAGGQAFDFQGDVSNRFQASALIEETRSRYGRVHILVSTAGVYKAEPFPRIDEWDWRRQLDVNLTGAFFVNQLLGRVMADEGGGVIVNVVSSLWNSTLPDGGAAYVASKAGLIAITRQAARELAPANIRVNAVCPGNIDEADSPVPVPNMLGRAGSPDEVAGAVLFLCSDAARFITGQALDVNGGSLG